MNEAELKGLGLVEQVKAYLRSKANETMVWGILSDHTTGDIEDTLADGNAYTLAEAIEEYQKLHDSIMKTVEKGPYGGFID